MKHHHTDRPAAAIEADIAQTRAGIDATLSAIESRLTRDALIDKGIDYLRHSGGNEFVSNLGASVRHNPMPVALAGIGIAWLMMSSRRGYTRSGRDEYGDDDLDDGHIDSPGARQRAREAVDGVKAAVRSARDSTAESAATVRERAAQMTDSARLRARRLKEGARHNMERARGGYDYVLREQPLALGAIGLAIGAVIAATLPRTRQEDEWMGDARDRVADAARDSAREKLRQAERVAAAAKGAAAAEAERQGVTGAADLSASLQRVLTPAAAQPRHDSTVRPAAMEDADTGLDAAPVPEPPPPSQPGLRRY
jgi:hypothetical protein